MNNLLNNLLVCGIDGGQSSTRCILSTLDGVVVGEGRGGALIHLSAQGGRERFATSVGEALAAAWSAANRSAQPIAALVMGSTGIEANSTEAAVADQILATLVETPLRYVCSDAEAALYGAHAGAPGIMVIAGTGSVALGRDDSGRMVRAGGWGWLLDDVGSALAIGRNGVQAALYAFDGRAAATTLGDLLLEHFALASLHDIKRIVYAPDFGSKGFGALAPLVSQAAVAGDEISQTIIKRAGIDLAGLVGAVLKQLTFAQSPVPVAPIGGAFEHVEGLRMGFSKTLGTTRWPVEVVTPRMSAGMGAVGMAIKLCSTGL